MVFDYFGVCRKYYEDVGVVSSITPFLKDRETVILSKYDNGNPDFKFLRYKRVQNPNDFNWNVTKAFNQFQRQYNIYNTVSTYQNGLPIICNAGMTKETIQQNKTLWKTNHENKITEYDWFIDIDSPSFTKIKILIPDIIKIINIIKKKGYEPRIIFSGCGFQITIPYKQLQLNTHTFKTNEENDIYNILLKQTKILHDTITESIDLMIYDSLRIQKTPNCLIVNTEKTKDIYITKILNIEQLKKFNLKMVKYNA